MNRFILFLIKFYRRSISPNKPSCCRYIPTCSEYALQAFEKYSFFKAMWLSIRRILRCNPLGGSGYDPLP